MSLPSYSVLKVTARVAQPHEGEETMEDKQAFVEKLNEAFIGNFV